jgi:hypothetical protein
MSQISQPDAPFEPPFVGQERIALVDWLVDLFDGVAATAGNHDNTGTAALWGRPLSCCRLIAT